MNILEIRNSFQSILTDYMSKLEDHKLFDPKRIAPLRIEEVNSSRESLRSVIDVTHQRMSDFENSDITPANAVTYLVSDILDMCTELSSQLRNNKFRTQIDRVRHESSMSIMRWCCNIAKQQIIQLDHKNK